MTYVLGLTGSIGMGKSTTAQMFRDLDVPVWDADAAVHRLYQSGAEGAKAISALCPKAIDADGSVSRPALRAAITQDATLLDKVNTVIHPLVAQDRAGFLRANTAALVVLDIPLLLETGGAGACDGVVVVTVPAEMQRARVLARGMSETDLAMILARQMPDAEKRKHADFIIETNTLDHARAQVQAIVRKLTGAGDA